MNAQLWVSRWSRLPGQRRLLPLLIGVPVVVTAAVFLLTLTMDDEYTSTAKILPPAIFSASSRLMGSGGESLNERFAEQLSIRYQSDMAVTVLKSAPLLDDLLLTLKRPDLGVRGRAQAARENLIKTTRLSASRDGVISVQVLDSDPVRAASTANAYVDALERYVMLLTASTARKRGVALSQQLNVATIKLAEAERDFVQSQARTGILKSDGQTSSVVNNLADLRQRLAVRESQLTAMSAFATANNPGYRRVDAEVQGLRLQIERITGKSTDARSAASSAKGSGDDELDFQRARRTAKAYEEVVDSLRKQLVQAQLEEGGQVSGVQVIERALPADRRSGPPRVLFALLAGIAALLAMTLWAGLTGFVAYRQTPLKESNSSLPSSAPPQQVS